MPISYKTVPNTKGNARYYKNKVKLKSFKHKRTLSKKLMGKYRHLYIKR